MAISRGEEGLWLTSTTVSTCFGLFNFSHGWFLEHTVQRGINYFSASNLAGGETSNVFPHKAPSLVRRHLCLPLTSFTLTPCCQKWQSTELGTLCLTIDTTTGRVDYRFLDTEGNALYSYSEQLKRWKHLRLPSSQPLPLPRPLPEPPSHVPTTASHDKPAPHPDATFRMFALGDWGGKTLPPTGMEKVSCVYHTLQS